MNMNIESNAIENMLKIRQIMHSHWKFQYNEHVNNIYVNDIDSLDNGVFEYQTKFIGYKRMCGDVDTIFDDHTYEQETYHERMRYYRDAAKIHIDVRKKVRDMLKDGMMIATIVDETEKLILTACNQNSKTYYTHGGSSGIAFPVGVNVNNVIAHDSKIVAMKDDRKLKEGDLVKIDIGIHINGNIIDSAFSHIVGNDDSIKKPLLDASMDSMYTAIKMCGVDQRLYEMSETIEEIIKSYEINITGAGDTLPIIPIDGIGGHDIKQYRIHGNKLILSKANIDVQGDMKMEENETYAIETYATSGTGKIKQHSNFYNATHFMEAYDEDIEANNRITKKDKKYFKQTDLYKWMKTRNGLPFSSSWIYNTMPKLEKAYKLGISTGQLIGYPPIFDIDESSVAQYEHTVHVNDGTVEIFSLSDDY
jgi:methionyl aminopeptidase